VVSVSKMRVEPFQDIHAMVWLILRASRKIGRTFAHWHDLDAL
jgi:hypothetical protein